LVEAYVEAIDQYDGDTLSDCIAKRAQECDINSIQAAGEVVFDGAKSLVDRSVNIGGNAAGAAGFVGVSPTAPVSFLAGGISGMNAHKGLIETLAKRDVPGFEAKATGQWSVHVDATDDMDPTVYTHAYTTNANEEAMHEAAEGLKQKALADVYAYKHEHGEDGYQRELERQASNMDAYVVEDMALAAQAHEAQTKGIEEQRIIERNTSPFQVH